MRWHTRRTRKCSAFTVVRAGFGSESAASDGFDDVTFIQAQIEPLGVVFHGYDLPGPQGAYRSGIAEFFGLLFDGFAVRLTRQLLGWVSVAAVFTLSEHAGGAA